MKNIKSKYSHEINKLNNYLLDLERGRIYEITKTPGYPSCSTLAQHIKDDLYELLNKIDNDEKAFSEIAAHYIDKL